MTQKTGIFDILAAVKWLHNMKHIDSPKVVSRRLHEAVLYDLSGSILLTVWGNLIDSIE